MRHLLRLAAASAFIGVMGFRSRRLQWQRHLPANRAPSSSVGAAGIACVFRINRPHQR
jgi:hypothetical protein